jgi:hypothetical protein
LPAETTTTMPAARVLLTTVRSVAAPHPSLGGQTQELLITWGARVGSGLSPFLSVGATNHWKHSAYLIGVPSP